MRFIGADLHKRSITFCVVEKHQDNIRVVKRQKIGCSDMKRIETFIQSHAPCLLTVEATIGYEWFDTILAELGDWSRFRNADAVVSHAGLDPGVRSSDGKRHDLKISKAGSPLLRWILIELAHRMKHTTARWAKAFLQISRKAGKKKATVAVARRLLLTIFAMLRDGRAYQAAAA